MIHGNIPSQSCDLTIGLRQTRCSPRKLQRRNVKSQINHSLRGGDWLAASIALESVNSTEVNTVQHVDEQTTKDAPEQIATLTDAGGQPKVRTVTLQSPQQRLASHILESRTDVVDVPDPEDLFPPIESVGR